MAITTQGFRLSALPQYTPVDPSLAAFNPMAAVQGFGTGLSLADMLQMVKKKRATMDAQIAAENARNQLMAATSTAALPNVQPQATLEGLKIGSQTKLVGPQTDLELAKIGAAGETLPSTTKLTIASNEAGIGAIQPLTAAQVADAVARKAEAESRGRMVQPKEGLAMADINQKLTGLQDAQKLHDNQLLLAQKELQDKLDHASDDMEKARLIRNFALDAAKAKAKLEEAQAKYYDLGGHSTADNTASQIRALSASMDALDKTYNLPAYESATYDENGKPIQNMIFPNPKIDQSKEKARALRNFYMQGILRLLNKTGVGALQDAGMGAEATGAEAAINALNQSPIQKQIAEAQDWLAKNPKDPRVPQVKRKLQSLMNGQ